MPDRAAFVYIVLPGETGFTTAGQFRADVGGHAARGRFAYARDYLERADAVALDPFELHLGQKVFETVRMEGFFGAFRDAMPDAWGRRILDRRLGPGLGEFDYLLESPDDRVGALGFGDASDPPEPASRFNAVADLQRLQQVADAVLRDEPLASGVDEAQMLELLQAGTSMGGARPKTVVQHDGALWLAKFECEGDAGAGPRVEHAMLNLARKCGLNATDSCVMDVGGRDVLLVRRFDREQDGSQYRRHRFVSAVTALQAEGGAADRTRWSYLLLADEIRRCSGRPADDLRELFGRMCFNAAVSNLDDHPRNHGLLAAGSAWRLSPAYDLTASPAVSMERRDLAMSCGEYGHHANRSNLLSRPDRFMLESEEAARIFHDVSEAVRNGWQAELRRVGVARRICEELAGAFLYDGLFLERSQEG